MGNTHTFALFQFARVLTVMLAAWLKIAIFQKIKLIKRESVTHCVVGPRLFSKKLKLRLAFYVS